MKLGVVAGVHEDIIRLQEAFSILDARGCTEFASLGDIVGFDPHYYSFGNHRDAHACVALIHERCEYAVLGNHDAHHSKRLPMHTTFDYPLSWHELSFTEKENLSRGKIWLYEGDLKTNLARDDIDYLLSLPEYKIIETQNKKLLLTHSVFPHPVGDIKKSGLPVSSDHFDFMQKNGCDVSFFSHELFKQPELYFEHTAQAVPWGTLSLKQYPVAVQIPWVANGTEPNGVAVFDTQKLEVEIIPLNTSPFTS